jgi:16S rRNA G966 N2-methylase RsmD
MDPPYADPAIRQILAAVARGELLAEQGLLVVGHATDVVLPEAVGELQRVKQKVFGGSSFSLYKRPGSADPESEESDDDSAAPPDAPADAD